MTKMMNAMITKHNLVKVGGVKEVYVKVRYNGENCLMSMREDNCDRVLEYLTKNNLVICWAKNFASKPNSSVGDVVVFPTRKGKKTNIVKETYTSFKHYLSK